MSDLPRLALISEVPPLSLSAGPAVLYRLLRAYPAGRLLLCDDAGLRRYPGHELEGVSRRRISFNWTRLMNSRFNRLHSVLAFLFGPTLLVGRLVAALRSFQAEAVVSVAHGHVWWPAYLAARKLNLPFYLIVHDHWRDCLSIPSWLNRAADRRFAAAYRGAAARYTVSPGMARRYETAYGVDAQVLYPSQHPDTEAHTAAPARQDRPFVFAYAGGMDGEWARRAAVELAHAVAPLGAEVHVYQNVTLAALQLSGLKTGNLTIHPFQPALELHRNLRAHADAMFLPMSFAAADRGNVELCFPSKLTDYTVPALPLLIYAPATGSAVDWARRNPGVALVVDQPDGAQLQAAARELVTQPELCARLGTAAAAAGRRDFSATKIFATFTGAFPARS